MVDPRSPDPRRKPDPIIAMYVVIPLVTLLVVGLVVAWTPLRIAYYEGQCRDADAGSKKYPVDVNGRVAQLDRRTWAACKLIRCGPRSYPALERLLCSQQKEHGPTRPVLTAMAIEKEQWTLPLAMGCLLQPHFAEERDGETEKHFLLRMAQPVGAVEAITGRSFSEAQDTYDPVRDVRQARLSILKWWSLQKGETTPAVPPRKNVPGSEPTEGTANDAAGGPRRGD